jgi:hypothetical protein
MGRLDNKKTPTMRQSHGGAALAEDALPIRSNTPFELYRSRRSAVKEKNRKNGEQGRYLDGKWQKGIAQQRGR